MLSREPGDRTLPTLITLLVIGVLLMTFDVRLQGGGVVGVVRTGVQTLIAPVQKGAAFITNPVADMFESLSNVARLREENIALRRELTETQAELIGVQEQLARLELLEALYRLETTGTELGRTVANVIGRPDPFDQALIINKGSADGVVVGQPVIDTNGFVVGTVRNVTALSAMVVPITAGPDGVTVLVGDQIGTLLPQIGSDEMRLEISDAREPVLAGTAVLTAAASISFPPGYPVGEVIEDATPTVDFLATTVRPSMQNPGALRIVIVLAWPPDPITAVAGEDPVPEPTTTTISEETTTTEGDG